MVFALPLVAIGAKSALAEDVQFTLNNATSYTLMEFYASPTDVENWEEDILGLDVLGSGKSIIVTIADDRTQCEYDIEGVFEDGESIEQAAVNLCDLNGGMYQFSE
ncbi:hypothetical protein H6F87_26590 [Cyanobacteria bacterium FACHB-502]|nr:hypothetical protein [Cyanobacteria bacterium FACHB-502]MBD2026365.1 hypothetical protein [Leptolyngbya sp. FACHB-711]